MAAVLIGALAIVVTVLWHKTPLNGICLKQATPFATQRCTAPCIAESKSLGKQRYYKGIRKKKGHKFTGTAVLESSPRLCQLLPAQVR
jgi:hypothetical protein